MFAQVILPLPLGVTFSYAIPDEMLGRIAPGYRVIVPFGTKKYYTGIVVAVTAQAAVGVDVKEVSLVLDTKPVVRHPQTRLWQWVSDYYLCPVGDVYKAAVPAGLKIESETFVEVNPDYEDDAADTLTEAEVTIIALLRHNKKPMRISDIESAAPGDGISLRSVRRTVSAMLDRGLIIISEKLVERYRPKTVTYISHNITTDMARRLAFEAVKGAPRQETLLMTLLMLTKEQPQVTLPTLLERSGCSRAILNALADKGLLTVTKRQISRFDFDGDTTSCLPQLTPAQADALKAIRHSWSDHQVTLLHGVTSSGKTQVYMHLIEETLNAGRQVLYLVPEIALTTQLTQRLQQVFGNKVLIYHSKFSDNERVDLWHKLLESHKPCIIIGSRTANFLPFDSLGLVIVDEEHDSSYKQFEPSPRYNGRDVAIVLASMHGAKVLLGSATPSIETYYKARQGKFGLVTLTERYGNAPLPQVLLVNTDRARRQGQMHGSLAQETITCIRDCVDRNRQAIVFRNRRGYAPMARCTQCSFVPRCDNCDVSLTYHKFLNRLVCHYCGSTYPLPALCPQCQQPAIEIVGYGTERIEDEVTENFPDARVCRMDLDTTRNKGAYADLIENFSEHRSDILVGTQMVTKGLDFKDVECVAVMNADSVINFPDFRSGERAFNMLEQVAGRAGRASGQEESRSSVVIQTSQPTHPVLRHLVDHDYEAHYNSELDQRRQYNYPPFSRIIYLYLRHKDRNKVADLARLYADELRRRLGNRVFGPEEPAVSRVNMYYIRKIMLKVEVTASITRVKEVLNEVFTHMATVSSTLRPGTLYYDVDPM